MTKELIHMGMKLASWSLPVKFVDFILVVLAYLWFGNLSKYGIVRPNKGPLLLKANTGRSAVIDVGTVELIKKGDIKVTKFLTQHRKVYINSIWYLTGSIRNLCGM